MKFIKEKKNHPPALPKEEKAASIRMLGSPSSGQ